MNYLLLILLLIILFVFFYHILNKDILSPTIISIIAFIICVLCAFLGLGSWNKYPKLNILVFLIIFIGILFFGFGEIFARLTNKDKVKNEFVYYPIYIDKWKIYLMVIVIIMTIVLMFLDIKRICAHFGFFSNSIPDLIAFYRTKSALFSTELISSGGGISFVTNQLLKVCNIFCIISIFCLANNLIIGEKIYKNKIYIFPIICACILSLFTSGRGLLMRYIVCLFIIWTILYRNYNLNGSVREKILKMRKVTFKILKTGLIFLLVAILIFYFILPLVGRNNNIQFLDYISFYFGAPIPSFNIFLESIPYHSDVFGEETLVGIYSFLNKFGITNFIQQASREFIDFGNLSSNIYTSFRRYYYDFGVWGVVICQFIFGFTFTKIYQKSSQKGNTKWLLFYGYMASILIDQIRDEAFFVTFVSSSTIVYAILINIICFFCFKLKVKFR